MRLTFTVQTWKKTKWYIAKCPELDFVAQGKDKEEAQRNLKEVIEIQFEEMLRIGTLMDYLEECGFDVNEDLAIPNAEMIGFEKLDMQVQ